MSPQVMARPAAWSVSAYRLVLQAYPPAFRREFGDSMLVVFSDLVRDTWPRAGLAGLAVLWVRTIRDVASSLGRAYAGDRSDPWFPAAWGLIAMYLCALAGVVGYGAIRYGEFYPPPAFTTFGTPAASETTLLDAYAQALTGEFGAYRTFAAAAGLSLAVLLGIASATFGLWQRSMLHGLGAFAAGAAVTIAALQLMPTVWFPLDRYPVSALWLIGGGVPLGGLTCLLCLAAGRLGPGRARFLPPR
jgi:hypothetical protein